MLSAHNVIQTHSIGTIWVCFFFLGFYCPHNVHIKWRKVVCDTCKSSVWWQVRCSAGNTIFKRLHANRASRLHRRHEWAFAFALPVSNANHCYKCIMYTSTHMHTRSGQVAMYGENWFWSIPNMVMRLRQPNFDEQINASAKMRMAIVRCAQFGFVGWWVDWTDGRTAGWL